jgi:hypothetical protein
MLFLLLCTREERRRRYGKRRRTSVRWWYQYYLNSPTYPLIRTPLHDSIVKLPVHHPLSPLSHTTPAVVTTTNKHRALPSMLDPPSSRLVQHDRDHLHKSTRIKSNSHISESLGQPGPPGLGNFPPRATPPAPGLARHLRSPAIHPAHVRASVDAVARVSLHLRIHKHT